MRDVIHEPDTTMETGPSRFRWIGFSVLILLFVLMGWPTLQDLVDLYLAEPDYSHGFLILPVCLYLVYLRRSSVAAVSSPVPALDGRPAEVEYSAECDTGTLAGLILTVLGTAVVTFGQWYDAVFLPMTSLYLSVSGLGLIICLLGLVWVLWGWKRGRLLVFPIAFLIFALPLPAPFMSRLTLSLQGLSSALAAGSLQIAGIPVLREGNVLHLPEGTIGVAAACSGIRSLWCLLALAVALAGVKRLRPWRAAFLVATVPLLGVAGNLARLFITGLFVARGRQDLALGTYHEALGLVTILLPGAAIFGLAAVLSRTRRREQAADGEERSHVGSQLAGEGKNEESPDATVRSAPKRNELPAASSALPCVPGEQRATSHQRLIIVLLSGFILVSGASVSGVVRHHYLTLYRSLVAEESSALAERKPLSEFPDKIGDFYQTSEHALSELESGALLQSDYLKRMYGRGGDPDIGLVLMFWNPRRVDMPRWPVLFPHVADACYPGAGWKRVGAFDRDLRVPWLADTDVAVRLFTRGDNQRLVVYWISSTHGTGVPGVASRLKTMFGSWEKPPSTHLRSQYSVKVEVGVQDGDVENAFATAMSFARLVAPFLWEYGIGEKIVE